MNDELRPCMCCGNTENIISETQWTDDDRPAGHSLMCECGLTIWGETEEAAVLLWNKRPYMAELEAREQNIPWDAIRHICTQVQMRAYDEDAQNSAAEVERWLDANAPQEEQP